MRGSVKMSRISHCFAQLKLDGKTALIPYITAGDPEPWVTVPMLHAFVEAGANLLELGVPFSDPMSDGPAIQKACERALKNEVSIQKVIEMVAQFREKDKITPVILMGYANPLEAMGYEQFAEQAEKAGVDGVLTSDMPLEESDDFLTIMDKHGIDTIFLVAPTTTKARMMTIAKKAKGFIYYVSLKGVTGSASIDVSELGEKLDILREHTELPIGVGFGIKDGNSAALVSEVADGVVVGSTLVNCIAEHEKTPELLPTIVAELVEDMRLAIDIKDVKK